ncbi:PolC-type DNA polymerase III [Georgenia sp. H159]|uniref:3'-5' exonuclease n=1 Tax=Georgenia sp. H159 TaxID=3076115 RepID=UPI002D76DC58|nr:exonuclease domain-containing protein [Georgenia sp. H159]
MSTVPVRPHRTAHVRPSTDERRMPFAEPGKTGPLFSYADYGVRNGHYRHDGPFAIVDVETTGFSPGRGDRVIEIAIARVDASGRIEDEYSTLINPVGRDTGAVFIHRITNEMVSNAPLFGDVAGDILSRLEGAVVVAHNAAFEERFLATEFAHIGLRGTSIPAVCSLWLGQRTFDTPNHKLATLAQHAGIAMPDAHAALGDVRAVAGLLPRMLDRHGSALSYVHSPSWGLRGHFPVGARRPVTRAVNLRKGQDGWMASLMSRLPLSASEVDDAAAAVYLETLGDVLEDGKIIGDEAKLLARIAGSAGMGAAQVAGLNERFLELMRDVALADDVLTKDELRQLNGAAGALGVPDYFDDLSPSAADAAPAPSQASTAVKTRAVRRCGHCRTPGHYRTTCPELT